jgi:hypothetical protein
MCAPLCVQVAALEQQQQQMQLFQQHEQQHHHHQQQQQQVDIAISDDHEGAGTVIHVRGPGSCSRMSDLGCVFDKLGECTTTKHQQFFLVTPGNAASQCVNAVFMQ